MKLFPPGTGLPALFALWVSAAAQAGEVAAHFQDVAKLREAAAAFAAARAQPGDRVEAIVDEHTRLPPCQAPLESYGVASSITAQTVALRCTRPAWTVYVPVRLQAVREVLVAARPLARGETLGADALRVERRELSTLQQGYLAPGAAIAGKQLSRAVAAGAALSPADLAAAFAIRRGQQVTLVGHAGGLEVRARGKALADAAIDQRVSVENSSSKRIIEGVVRSADTVDVGL